VTRLGLVLRQHVSHDLWGVPHHMSVARCGPLGDGEYSHITAAVLGVGA
jgi:hypothetical protein